MIKVNSVASRALTFFCVLWLFGINVMLGIFFRTGYYRALLQSREEGWKFFPGTTTPVLTKLTGITRWDSLNNLGLVMFSNIFDGSAPQFSLFALQFGGNLVQLLAVIMVEGERNGSRRSILSRSAVWGMLTQFPGYGFAMPLYTLAHLYFSQTMSKDKMVLATAVRPRNVTALETLIPSIILGYLVPTVLMCLPFFWFVHQWIAALWQGFPLWTALLQWLLQSIERVFRVAHGSESQKPLPELDTEQSEFQSSNCLKQETDALGRLYLFSISVSAITHLATLTLIMTRNLFPGLFSEATLQSFSFRQVFLPSIFYSTRPMKIMGAAMLSFFQYDQYVGAVATLAWTSLLWWHSRTDAKIDDLLRQITKILALSLVAGPGPGFVLMIWDRDIGLLLSCKDIVKRD